MDSRVFVSVCNTHLYITASPAPKAILKTFLAAVHMSFGCCQREKHVHENHLGHHTLNREKTNICGSKTNKTNPTWTFIASLECYKMFHLSKFYGINTILQYSNQKNYFKYNKSGISKTCTASQVTGCRGNLSTRPGDIDAFL